MKYAYIRVSTNAQEDSGVGMHAQEMTTQRLAAAVDDDWGITRFPHNVKKRGYYVDVTSAYTVSFFDRAAGKALLKVLDDGDTIMMTRLDRGFRTVIDFCNFMKVAKTYNWNLVCADPPIDLSTPTGRMFATTLATMAQWESEIKGQRIKEALAAKKGRKGTLAGKNIDDPVESLPSEYRRDKTPKITRSEHRVSAGRVFVYIRCSHRSSVESGLGLRYQMETCCSYADALVKEYPQLTFDNTVITDPAISALSTPLSKRSYGGIMYKELQRGDTVVCLRPDRVFGSIADMSDVIRNFKDRGIKLHFAEGGLNLDSAFGEQILSVMVMFAEMERKFAAARAKDSRAALEEDGKFTGGKGYPPFWMGFRMDGKKKLILDRRQLVTFRLIKGLVDRGMSIRKALERCEELIAQREDRKVIPASGVRRIGYWATLPDYYIPYSNGFVYPMWTARKFFSAKPLYAKAIEQWRSKVLEEKSALKAIAERDGLHRPIMKSRRKKLWARKVPVTSEVNDGCES